MAIIRKNEFNIRINPKPQYMGYGYDLRLVDEKSMDYVENFTIRHVENNGEIVPSLFTISNEQIQQLMNELWNLGIRPTNGAGDNNAFEAVKYHLEDMRKLVFKDKK